MSYRLRHCEPLAAALTAVIGALLGLILALGILALCLALGIGVARAQTPTLITKIVGQTAMFRWVAPTLNTNGTPITEALTYTLLSVQWPINSKATCLSPLGDPTIVVSRIAALTYTVPAYTAAGIYCYTLTASDADGTSPPSNAVTVTVRSKAVNGVGGFKAD